MRDDILVYFEPDPAFAVDVATTKDGRLLTINVNSRDTSEVWLIDESVEDAFASNTTRAASGMQGQGHAPKLRLVAPRNAGTRYFVEHFEERDSGRDSRRNCQRNLIIV